MRSNSAKIRKATVKDFDSLYKLGLKTPEFKVSSDGEFMDKEEFLFSIKNKYGVFLVAESKGEPVGFVYANRQDPEQALGTKWACLVYIVVKTEYRKMGIAQKLYEACVKELKNLGVHRVYGWANAESDGSIIKFMEKNGFHEGHKYVWMDKKV